jgi:hypothetical protein
LGLCYSYRLFNFQNDDEGHEKTSAKIGVAPISQEVNVIKEAKIYL